MNEMTEAEAQKYDRRRDRFEELLDEFGKADDCDADYEGPLGQWALMEADEGSADNGGPWWTTGDNWRALLYESQNQEYAEDWPPELLVNLDTGEQYDDLQNGLPGIYDARTGR